MAYENEYEYEDEYGCGTGAVVGQELPGAEVRGLAERWLPQLGAGDEDFVCSPAGLWLALAAVAAGARGGTAQELRGLLGVAGPDAARAVTAGARALAGTDTLAVATGVWSRVPVYREYREALPDIGFGPMDPDGIDAWVAEAFKSSGGLIERLPVRVDPDTLLVLVNALALKARWEDPFQGSATSDKPFTDAAGREHRVPTMHGPVPPARAWAVGDARVVELVCAGGTGGRPPARVRFVLGAPGAAPAEVLAAAWAAQADRRGLDADQVTVALPRLTLRTRLRVDGALRELGVRQAFRDDADFSGLSPEPLAISQVVQEAVVKVAERGVEAAGVTAIMARLGSAYRPPRRVEHIAYDRPFGVAVLDGTGEIPLFTAWQAGAPNA
ncbi:serpin family protein [Streptomyces sp. NPDC002851]